MTAAKKPRGLRAPARRQVVGHKGGEKQQKKPVVASNDTGSIATAQLLYIWSWGPIVGPVNGLKSIKLAGTPLVAEDGTVNYPGVKWQFRSGELNQERLTGITEASNEIQVGQELRTKAPYLRSINNAMLDAVRVRLSWPQLTHQDSTGNISGVRIEYAIDIATDGGPYQTLVASEVNRKNITKYERDHRIELPAGSRWTVRVRRITPEAGSEFIQDGMYVEAIAELVDSDQEYPLTAVGSIEYDAQQFGGDIAKIAVLMRGRIVKVPANYNAVTRTYATSGPGTSGGIWDGTFKEAYTNNPAWVLYDLVLHPYYGLGERINASMVNRWSLYRIGQFCDQLVPDGMGGQEPRFTCNLYLQKQADAWAVIQDLASIFHGLAFWDGSQIIVNADMPQDSAYTYTMAQIIGGNAVSYQGSKWRDRHSQAIVSFDDPAQGFDTDKEPVFDEDAIAEFGVRELSVEAPGCTSRGQAQRAGHWALMTEQLQTRGTTIRVGLDGYIPKPGKVISLADPMLAGRANGGRIAAVAGRVVTLDRDIVVPSGARLLVNLPSGKSEARQVRSVAGRKVTVMADYSEVPQAECGWALDYDDLKLMQFYVRNVTRPEWHQFQLELIQHEPSKFSAIDYGTMIDDRPISVLPPGVQAAPARVLITSHSAIDQGIAVTTMTIGWEAAPGAVAYEVEWRWGSREWVRMPATGELATDVRGVYAGQYLARVRAISAMDVASIPTTSMLTNVAGKTTPPPAVTHLTTESLIFGIGLKWGFPAGAQDTQRTELWYSAGSVLAEATKLADLAYPQDKHTLQGLRAGQRFFFWARLVDRSGNVGPWFPSGTTLVTGQASADAGPILEQIKDQITESELGKQLTSKIEKIALIDGNGPGSVNERVGSAKTELAKQISDVNNALSTTKTNLQQQITAVSADVTAAKTDLQQQIANVSALAGSLPYRKDKAYSTNQSALGSDGKLYQAVKAVPLNTPPPNATYWTDVGQAVVTAAGTAARVQTVETKMETLEGSSSAQASQITGLQTSLTTTNGNVAAAQTAADAANSLAGGKGKVIIQAAAPGVADRLAQNLWIDTTGNANTPKRWTGSAWAAVTDKAATDAATAAAGALALAQTKADASVVSSISTRVTDAEGKLTSQATRLDGMQTSIDGKASSQALQQVTSRVTATEQKDAAQDQQLTSQSQALTSLTDSVSKKADSAAVQSLSNEVKQQGQSLTAQGQSLTRIDTKLLASQDNSPTKAYQSVFSDMAQDQWASTNSGAGASASFGVPAGITRGAALILDGGSSNRTWWGASTRKVRFDPTRLYKLTVRVQQVAMGAGAPGIYAGLDCYAEDGKTRISTQGTSSVGSSHYVLLSNRRLSQGEWATAEVYVKGHTIGSEGGAAGAGTLADPKRLKEGTAWVSPMLITGYSDAGGQAIVDYFDIEDATEQAQIDAGATATTAIGARVERTEQGLTSVSQQTTQLTNSLAKKAEASTVQALANTVEQQGTNISAAGRALVSVEANLNRLGASGVNLVPAEYCAFTKDLPAMYSNGSVNISTVADPQALKGYALKADSRAVDSHTFGLNTSLTAPGCNMDFKPGKYLVSFYAKAETAGHMVGAYARVLLADGSTFKTSNAPTFALTTSWARYAGVIDLTDPAYTGTQMQLAIQSNRSGVANRITYFDRFMFEAVVNEQKEPSTFSMGNSFDQVQTNALANTALTGRVERAESGVTSVSGQLTELNNSIGDVGAENLVFNPSFERVDPGTPGMADGWWYDGTGSTTRVPTLVPSSLASGTAQRLDVTGLTPSTWARFYVKSQFRFKPVPGKTYTASVYMRGTPGLRILPQVYGTTDAGAGTESWAAVRADAASDWVRLTVTFSPGAATSKIYASVVVYGGGAASSGFIEADRYQIEEGVRATGWRDNGQVNSFESSALSSAVTGLSSTVSQQGTSLSSVSSRTTSLENAVNSTSSGLPSKASTSALQSIAGRVAATEGGLTAANSSITRIGSQISGIGGTGSNLMPAEYSTFTDTLPPFRAQGGIAISAQADSSAYSSSVLKIDSGSGSGWVWLAGSPSDFNLRLVAERQYIVSFWAKGSAAHNVAVRLRYQNTGGGETEIAVANVNVATDMARLSLTFTAPAALAGPACIVLFTQSAGNAGITWFDGFMVEEKIGEATAPSAFTPGTSTRQAAGQALAVAALDTKVTQQGAKIESEAKRTDGLYTSVGNTNAAIQSEASARTDGDTALGRRIDTVQSSVGSTNASIQSEAQTRASADTALGRRVDTVQSNLGNTNASVQQVATAQANLKGELNAQYSVRVQVNHQGGYYKFAGFGIGVTEQGGVAQSAFVVNADQFVLLNGNDNALSAPFAVAGGQTFVADAYIRDASIGTAKIADAAITAAKIGVAEVDTLRIRGNAVTVPTTYTVPDSSAGAGTGAWMDLVAIQVTMDQPGMIQVQFSCAQDYTNAQYFFRSLFEVYINGTRIATAGGSAVSTSPVLVGAIGVGAGTFIIKARWWAENSTIVVRDKVLFAMGCKR